MKIQFPTPQDFLHREQLFFEQLELAIYHAKKSWDKIKAQYTEEDEKNENYPWLSFGLEIESDERVEKLFEEIDPDYEKRQEISLEITEL